MNVNPETIAAAAERLRAVYGSKDPMTVYQIAQSPNAPQDMMQAVYADRTLLADAYIASLRGDDGEPLTEEWLRSVGGEWNDQQAGFGFRDRSLELWIRPNGQCWMFESSTYGGRVCLRKKLTTRGAFRNLASALNIPLKNPAEQNEPREGREGR